MKKALSFFSYACHPLFMPLFATLYYLFATENYLIPAEKLLVIVQIVIITVLIPVALFFLLRSMGKISSIMADNVNERKIPLFIQLFLLFLLIRQSFIAEKIPELHVFFLAAMLSTLFALVFVLAQFKVSLHMLGMAALLFFVMALSYENQSNNLPSIAVLCLVTGLVATSRLDMEAHTHTELAIGFLCGMVPQIAMFAIYKI